MNVTFATVLLDHSSGILLLIDPTSLAIREVSNPTIRLLGYRREELLGRPITDIECSLADAFFWADVRAGGHAVVKNIECSYRCAGGEIITTTKTISRVECDGQAWLVVHAEPRDFRFQNDDQLANVASMLQATLEATADGILVVGQAGNIVNMNQRFARMWRLSEALLMAQEDSAIFRFMAGQFSDPNGYQTRLSDIASNANDETFDVLHLADGRYFERKSMPARHGAKVFGVVFSFTDITARKQAEAAHRSLEAQLRESQKMEAIGTLAGGIAHDFNNILVTILGNTELARQDASSNPLALESLEEIRKAGSRARDLVQQILSFSRRQPTERKPVALAPIFDEVERLLRATLPARLTLDVECEAGLPMVLADANQIIQVVINLATNAMQAMPNGPGRIGIRLDKVALNATLADGQPMLRAFHHRHPGHAVRIAVKDNGHGMDAGTMARIFEPFFTTKAVDEGTGLGLAVVHGIVQAHDGAIVVDSAPQQGTIFMIYLPPAEVMADEMAETPAADAQAKAAMPDRAAGQHIVYIDDDESLVFLVARRLERRGYHVGGYTDQQEALAVLRTDPAAFDLVVTDYNMPGMSGLDVAREVRSIRADLPVAVASGFIDEALREQAAGAGVTEVIFKANAVEDLCDAFVRLAHKIRDGEGSA